MQNLVEEHNTKKLPDAKRANKFLRLVEFLLKNIYEPTTTSLAPDLKQ